MNLYAIRREKAWASPEELEETAGRSKQVADDEFPDDIHWIRSYVIKEDGGTLGTICIYEASNIDAVKAHAKRVDMPADEVLEIADTVVIRPDPQAAAASSLTQGVNRDSLLAWLTEAPSGPRRDGLRSARESSPRHAS